MPGLNAPRHAATPNASRRKPWTQQQGRASCLRAKGPSRNSCAGGLREETRHCRIGDCADAGGSGGLTSWHRKSLGRAMTLCQGVLLMQTTCPIFRSGYSGACRRCPRADFLSRCCFPRCTRCYRDAPWGHVPLRNAKVSFSLFLRLTSFRV